MVKNSKGKMKGFTIIELSLSLIFISVISIIVAVMVTNAISAFNKGITMDQLNTEGMDLVDEIRLAIQGSPARPVVDECKTIYSGNDTAISACESDRAFGFIMRKQVGKVNIGRGNVETETDVPLYGIFCTGKYSYLWNSGYYFTDDAANPVENMYREGLSLKYKVGKDEKTISNFRLIRAEDPKRDICKLASGYNSSSTSAGSYSDVDDGLTKELNVTSVPLLSEPEVVLKGVMTGDPGKGSGLALYDLTSTQPAMNGNSNNLFYSISFVLGTVRGGINVMDNGNYCKTPEDYENSDIENFDYCAINKFNFAAQTTGG